MSGGKTGFLEGMQGYFDEGRYTSMLDHILAGWEGAEGHLDAAAAKVRPLLQGDISAEAMKQIRKILNRIPELASKLWDGTMYLKDGNGGIFHSQECICSLAETYFPQSSPPTAVANDIAFRLNRRAAEEFFHHSQTGRSLMYSLESVVDLYVLAGKRNIDSSELRKEIFQSLLKAFREDRDAVLSFFEGNLTYTGRLLGESIDNEDYALAVLLLDIAWEMNDKHYTRLYPFHDLRNCRKIIHIYEELRMNYSSYLVPLENGEIELQLSPEYNYFSFDLSKTVDLLPISRVTRKFCCMPYSNRSSQIGIFNAFQLLAQKEKIKTYQIAFFEEDETIEGVLTGLTTAKHPLELIIWREPRNEYLKSLHKTLPKHLPWIPVHSLRCKGDFPLYGDEAASIFKALSESKTLEKISLNFDASPYCIGMVNEFLNKSAPLKEFELNAHSHSQTYTLDKGFLRHAETIESFTLNAPFVFDRKHHFMSFLKKSRNLRNLGLRLEVLNEHQKKSLKKWLEEENPALKQLSLYFNETISLTSEENVCGILTASSKLEELNFLQSGSSLLFPFQSNNLIERILLAVSQGRTPPRLSMEFDFSEPEMMEKLSGALKLNSGLQTLSIGRTDPFGPNSKLHSALLKHGTLRSFEYRTYSGIKCRKASKWLINGDYPGFSFIRPASLGIAVKNPEKEDFRHALKGAIKKKAPLLQWSSLIQGPLGGWFKATDRTNWKELELMLAHGVRHLEFVAYECISKDILTKILRSGKELETLKVRNSSLYFLDEASLCEEIKAHKPLKSFEFHGRGEFSFCVENVAAALLDKGTETIIIDAVQNINREWKGWDIFLEALRRSRTTIRLELHLALPEKNLEKNLKKLGEAVNQSQIQTLRIKFSGISNKQLGDFRKFLKKNPGGISLQIG